MNDFGATIPVPIIAKLCGISEEAVRKWCRTGFLKARKEGKLFVVYQTDLIEHFATVPKHYHFLVESEPTDSKLRFYKAYLIRKILKDRRDNRHAVNDETNS